MVGSCISERLALQSDVALPPGIYRSWEAWSNQSAVITPHRKRWSTAYHYEHVTFAELGADIDRISSGLQALGMEPGDRIALLVPFSRDFLTLVFAILRTGAAVVLVDPGLGLGRMLDCLAQVEPDGFVGVAAAHAVRWWHRKRFPKARMQVVVGRGWPGTTLHAMRTRPNPAFRPVALRSEDPAAIIFTSGSTGPAKGVLFTHANFESQIRQVQAQYDFRPGALNLACFPLFALFNANMGVTTVLADMLVTRPAQAVPRRLVRMIRDLRISHSFASPAVWNRIGRYCEAENITLPSLSSIHAAGAPVATHILRRMRHVMPKSSQMFTPYGATEALPVASISADEVLDETAARSADGAGTCVGRRFPEIQWKIIGISDGPIAQMNAACQLPAGAIGELIVRGPQVTPAYVSCADANRLHKIRDGDVLWHRMGDVGYLDEDERFWFCGRKAHRVVTPQETLYTIPCEAILNQHPQIYRTALVGLGEYGQQVPVLVCEPWPECWPTARARKVRLLSELARRAASHPRTAMIPGDRILLCRTMPVDARHNAKILRETLGPWVRAMLGLPRHPSA